MNMYKKYFLILLMIFAFMPTVAADVTGIEPGVKAPQFNIKSGDDKEMSLNRLHDKTVIVFYETKDAIEQNRLFKKELAILLKDSEALKAKTTVLSVIDCSYVPWVTKKLWKNNLVKNSKKENLIIYGDWDGSMSADYRMEDGKSNIVIIDRTGIIRYFKSGKLSNNEIDQCKELIQKLAGNK